MTYDAETDSYICHAGHRLTVAYERKTRSRAGYPTITTVYSCHHCSGCLHKERCIKGSSKVPLEQRSKNLFVAKNFQRQRQEMEARITTKEGILLRQNRSIQVEGAFGVIKQDMGFRRFLLRGQVKVETEFLLLAFAFNINKLHQKVQSNRCGEYLHVARVA